MACPGHTPLRLPSTSPHGIHHRESTQREVKQKKKGQRKCGFSYLDRTEMDIVGGGKHTSKGRRDKHKHTLSLEGIMSPFSNSEGIFRQDAQDAPSGTMSNFAKSNSELYHQYKVLAPKLLEEISRLLIACRSLGIIMPRGIKNIFEFTWEELIMEPPSPSVSKITGLEVYFGQPSSVDLPFSPGSRRPMTKNPPSPSSLIQPMPNSQQILQKFQKKSMHLLSELLSLKLKMIIECSAGPTPMDISKQFVEASQILHLKAKEIILESMLDTVGLGKGGNRLSVFTAIGVSSPYQLVFQSSNACLSFSLSGAKERRAKPSKQKISGADDSTGRITGSSSSELFMFNDPCLQAREKLQEMCRVIEAEKNSWKGKRFSFPVILHNYTDKKSSSHSSIYNGDSKTLLHPTTRPPYPIGHRTHAMDTKWKRAFRFHYTFYDGTTFVFYPSGHVAVSQDSYMLQGRYTTCIFNDTPNFPIIGLFTAEGHGSVQYNLKNRYPCMFMMNHEGGCIKDTMGHTVHKWSWTSKKRTLISLEYKMNEQIKLNVYNQDYISITFSALNENVTLLISPTDCPHGAPPEKRYPFRSSAEERTSKMIRALVEIKKRFQKTVSQFMNSVLLSAGLLTIDYPVKDEIDLCRFRKKSPSILQWIPQSTSESLPRTRSALHTSSMAESFRDDSSSAVMGGPKKGVRISAKVPDRSKSTGVPDPRSSNTWAFALADCPLMLRKLLLKQDTTFGCRCLVKSPAVTDLEFERFISAPRDPSQILVLYVMTSQSSTNASHLEWILDTLYMHNQCGRPSPCIQCRRDPYRLLRYNIHGALQEDPPLLVQKYDVMPGMVLMFAGGKLLFGGFIFNGYGCCSKKNLLKQIFLARQQNKMGYFLPDNFKFSTLSPFPQTLDNYKDQEEEEDEQETKANPSTSEKDKKSETQPVTEEGKKKDLESVSTSKPMLLETLIDSTPLDLKIRRKSKTIRKKGIKLKK
ncbi:uncharacterized protein C3orf20 homolog [Dromiciops gliroides]|uniref:uncharacterized protein C3orf20 homolog n=1 Tax=Dromiciops gliroides TaxID=33562 RepID=UPI001CC6FFF8|nr:uncharacterized protein C3orf20 homolog [Dromiciops gliroides]